MRSPIPLSHPVVILGRGLGTRLAEVSTQRHKTSETVAGRPVLSHILTQLETVRPTHIYLHLREPDPVAEAAAAAHPQPVTVDVRPPAGYLPDVAACTQYGPRFTVLEADTLTHPGSLRNLLILADFLGESVDGCVGIAPRLANMSGPSVAVNDAGLITSIDWDAPPSGVVPLGAWHWHTNQLDGAEEFVRDTGSTSIATYLTERISFGARILPISIATGLNVNHPIDLDASHERVTAWTTTTERKSAL